MAVKLVEQIRIRVRSDVAAHFILTFQSIFTGMASPNDSTQHFQSAVATLICFLKFI